jgi:hypothetical protein
VQKDMPENEKEPTSKNGTRTYVPSRNSARSRYRL